MKMNNLNDGFFKNVVKNDPLQIEPDASIEQRLNYAFMLKSPVRKVHSNSFTLVFNGLFAIKQLGLKTAFASVMVFSLFFVGNLSNHNASVQLADSCKVNSLVVDSNYMVKDTCK